MSVNECFHLSVCQSVKSQSVDNILKNIKQYYRNEVFILNLYCIKCILYTKMQLLDYVWNEIIPFY